MKIVLILCVLLFSVTTFSKTENDSSREILLGNWVYFKDSNSIGKVNMISDVFDTLRFSNDGKYTRTLSTTIKGDATVIENGLWNYSRILNEATLFQSTKNYFYQGKKDTYDYAKWPQRIINVDSNQFIIVFTADANEKNEVFEIYLFYRKL